MRYYSGPLCADIGLMEQRLCEFLGFCESVRAGKTTRFDMIFDKSHIEVKGEKRGSLCGVCIAECNKSSSICCTIYRTFL